MSVDQLISNIVNAGSSGSSSGMLSGTVNFNELISRFNAISGNQVQNNPSIHQINSQLASLIQDQLLRNGTSAYSNGMFSFKEHFDPFLPFNDTRRINSKKMNIEKLFDDVGLFKASFSTNRESRKRFGRRGTLRDEDKLNDGKFFAAGWGMEV